MWGNKRQRTSNDGRGAIVVNHYYSYWFLDELERVEQKRYLIRLTRPLRRRKKMSLPTAVVSYLCWLHLMNKNLTGRRISWKNGQFWYTTHLDQPVVLFVRIARWTRWVCARISILWLSIVAHLPTHRLGSKGDHSESNLLNCVHRADQRHRAVWQFQFAYFQLRLVSVAAAGGGCGQHAVDFVSRLFIRPLIAHPTR